MKDITITIPDDARAIMISLVIGKGTVTGCAADAVFNRHIIFDGEEWRALELQNSVLNYPLLTGKDKNL